MKEKEKSPSSSVGLQQSAKFSRQNAQNTTLNSGKKTSSIQILHNKQQRNESHLINALHSTVVHFNSLIKWHTLLQMRTQLTSHVQLM